MQNKQYHGEPLLIGEMLNDPMQQFQAWYQKIVDSDMIEPNAMMLSTVNENNQPHSRMVLLKQFSKPGFIFFTNYHSQKAQDIEHNSQVSLLFWWPDFYQQVRIEGKIKKLPEQESTDYFLTRDRESQISALASPQSQIIESRVWLEKQRQTIAEKYQDQIISRPEFWGGYCVKPHYFEFWQGREHRLHDRICYRLESNQWIKMQLAP